MPIVDPKKRLPGVGEQRLITRKEFLLCKAVSDYVHIKSLVTCDISGNPQVLDKKGKPLPVSPLVSDKLALALRSYWAVGSVTPDPDNRLKTDKPAKAHHKPIDKPLQG